MLARIFATGGRPRRSSSPSSHTQYTPASTVEVTVMGVRYRVDPNGPTYLVATTAQRTRMAYHAFDARRSNTLAVNCAVATADVHTSTPMTDGL